MSVATDRRLAATSPDPVVKRLKVLIVVPALGGGGAEMHVARLLTHLDPAAFEGVLVCLRHGGDYHDRLPPHVRVRYACRAIVQSSTASAYLAIPALAAMLRNERPDVVCSFLAHATASLQIALRLSGLRSALVVGLQNNPSREQWASALITWPLKRAYRSALRGARTIVALSNGVAGAFREANPALADKVCRIYNIGLDGNVSALTKVPVVETCPDGALIVACGRLAAQKDYPTLLRAFRRISARHPARLWILGRGPLEDSLAVLAADLGIADRVSFLGFRSNPFAYMARADCFVLSSAWEGLANVLVEAMACGSPVVSTRCPFGPEEIITDGVNGLLVGVGDADALADAVIRVLTDRALAGNLATAGAARALDFTAAATVGLYERVFEQAAGSPPRAGLDHAQPRTVPAGR
jgi:glycosyltransferase involved in cell wall biosynthesis